MTKIRENLASDSESTNHKTDGLRKMDPINISTSTSSLNSSLVDSYQERNEEDEPILCKENRRFVLYPIKYPDVSSEDIAVFFNR